MTPQMKEEVIDVAMTELRGILTEHIESIDESMQTMLADWEKETEFSYPVSLGLKLTPRASAVKVCAKISYSVRHSDETVGGVADPNQMKMELD